MKNYIAIVLDESGSMCGIVDQVVNTFNDQMKTIKEESKGQETYVSLLKFNSVVDRLVFDKQSVAVIKPLTRSNYKPSGLTALFDGVGTVIDDFKKVPDINDENVSFLVLIITDGEENASRRYNSSHINQLLMETQLTGRWTFAFLMPPGEGKRFANEYGIPNDNIREWENTVEGVKVAAVATQQGFKNYFMARSAGKKKVDNFYVTTDMSKVVNKDVYAKLTDISDKFKVFEVPTESRIDEFITNKSKKNYVIGSSYYQLMKKETIQVDKRILVMEKGKKAIWGGVEARKLVGLPDNTTAKVSPGNHSNFDIFIESRSVNRKLPRGTKVLWDKTHVKDAEPTWNHLAVAENV